MSQLQQLLQEADLKRQQQIKNPEHNLLSNSLQNTKYQFLSDSLAFLNCTLSPSAICLILGYSEAFDYMLSFTKKEPFEITEETIKNMHSLIFSHFPERLKTEYRTVPFQEKEFGYRSPSPNDLTHVMRHFTDQYRSSCTTLHPIELCAMMTKRFLDIHPFMEGNEAIAFLLMNAILLHHGYPIIAIPLSLREQFLSALNLARTEYDMDPLCILFSKLVLASYHE